MLKNDKWIKEQAETGMITPFVPELVRKVDNTPHISYGLSSYAYDIRLSPKEFLVFSTASFAEEIDPKNFDRKHLKQAELQKDEHGAYFVIPANSYALGFALERIEIPKNILVLCIGKSTYARCGIIANLTPVEPGWKGHLTLEFSNASPVDCRIYANEGVAALIFFEGQDCTTTYEDRRGKYQNQGEQVTLARMSFLAE